MSSYRVVVWTINRTFSRKGGPNRKSTAAAIDARGTRRTLLLLVTWLYRYTSECGVMPCICEAAAKVSGLTASSFSSSSEDIEGSFSWVYMTSEGILHKGNRGEKTHTRKREKKHAKLTKQLYS